MRGAGRAGRNFRMRWLFSLVLFSVQRMYLYEYEKKVNEKQRQRLYFSSLRRCR